MSTEGDARDSKNLFLQALKGQITIHFVDGDTLEGEFLSQDELNIFLKIHDEPIMIPRSQIRFIKGRPGQQLEPDQLVETGQPTLAEQDLDKTDSQVDTLDDTDTTVVLADEGEAPMDEAMVFDEAAEPAVTSGDDLEDATFELQDVGVAFADDEDPTLVFKEERVEVDQEEDKTFVFKEEEGEISAYLDCTTGPHAGQTFQLSSGVITIGRTSDNIFSLSNDKEASRKHSKIVYEAGNFIIEDQNSLNGTFVNDERIESPRYLEDGDIILVGISTFVFHGK